MKLRKWLPHAVVAMFNNLFVLAEAKNILLTMLLVIGAGTVLLFVGAGTIII